MTMLGDDEQLQQKISLTYDQLDDWIQENILEDDDDFEQGALTYLFLAWLGHALFQMISSKTGFTLQDHYDMLCKNKPYLKDKPH